MHPPTPNHIARSTIFLYSYFGFIWNISLYFPFQLYLSASQSGCNILGQIWTLSLYYVCSSTELVTRNRGLVLGYTGLESYFAIIIATLSTPTSPSLVLEPLHQHCQDCRLHLRHITPLCDCATPPPHLDSRMTSSGPQSPYTEADI